VFAKKIVEPAARSMSRTHTVTRCPYWSEPTCSQPASSRSNLVPSHATGAGLSPGPGMPDGAYVSKRPAMRGTLSTTWPTSSHSWKPIRSKLCPWMAEYSSCQRSFACTFHQYRL